MASPLLPPTSAAGDTTAISDVHRDIIRTHILTRLDGPSLAAATCASSLLHSLSTEDDLWRDVCSSTWPSTATDPRLSHIISTFRSGHRSFFSDSYPVLTTHHDDTTLRAPPPPDNLQRESCELLISAVDIRFGDELIFSKVHETETVSGWFLCSPFRVDLLDPKDTVPTRVRTSGNKDDGATWRRRLEENLRVSWIVVDPTQKRAANFTSGKPVAVQRHWLTGEVQARYVTVVAVGGGGKKGRRTSWASKEWVQCGVTATCGGEEGGEMQVREVSFQVEDMEGRTVSGRESLAILREAIWDGERKRESDENHGRARVEEFEERKRRRRERRQRRERALDLVCISVGVTVFVAFWSFILFR